MICAGIDAGSRAIKAVLFDHQRSEIIGYDLTDQGVDQQRLAAELFDRTLGTAQLSRGDLAGVVATGYGRHRIPFANTVITEISCHARGVHHLAPDARTIVEIGGQDSKVISLDAQGRVRDFAMNDRCAAGTGRFLEVLAARLGVDLPALGELSRESRSPAVISSMCVVFAETEIIGLLADGTPAPDIAAGVQNAIASRIVALAGRSLSTPVYLTGGVALQPGMIRAISTTLNCPIRTVSLPQYTGALGAALLALRRSPGPSRDQPLL
jgi:(R)-2-hydroxyacyl-CoA dehydratese activating ATPase